MIGRRKPVPDAAATAVASRETGIIHAAAAQVLSYPTSELLGHLDLIEDALADLSGRTAAGSTTTGSAAAASELFAPLIAHLRAGQASESALIELQSFHVQAFDLSHLAVEGEDLAVGDNLMVIGFPLGFHDTVHHLAVARSASIASAYGVRFQQQGYFLTDARTHRGSSGAPVLRRRSASQGGGSSLSAWQLLGVHSTRMDMRTRDLVNDESLGLNCAWYADVLTVLTVAS